MSRTRHNSPHEDSYLERSSLWVNMPETWMPWGERNLRRQHESYRHRDGVGKGNCELWSRRPMNGSRPCRSNKKACIHIERARQRQEMFKVRNEIDNKSAEVDNG